MPVDMKKFEEGTEPKGGKRIASARPKVREFMEENCDTGYTTKEVADETGVLKATVNGALRHFAEKGMIERRTVEGLIYNRWIGDEEPADPEDDSEDDPEDD